MRTSSKFDEVISALTLLLVCAVLLQVGRFAYQMFARDDILERSINLPDGVRDWRGEYLPPLVGLAALKGMDLSSELAHSDVVIAFLQTTCPACESAKPDLERFVADNPTVGFVGIFAEPETTVRSYDARYPAFIDEVGATFSEFDVVGLPTFLTVRDGIVAEQYVGWSPEVLKGFEQFASKRR